MSGLIVAESETRSAGIPILVERAQHVFGILPRRVGVDRDPRRRVPALGATAWMVKVALGLRSRRGSPPYRAAARNRHSADRSESRPAAGRSRRDAVGAALSRLGHRRGGAVPLGAAATRAAAGVATWRLARLGPLELSVLNREREGDEVVALAGDIGALPGDLVAQRGSRADRPGQARTWSGSRAASADRDRNSTPPCRL